MSNQRLSDYLRNALVGFEHDPPTSQFQRGFMAALIQTGRTMGLSLPWAQFDRVLTETRNVPGSDLNEEN